ENGREISRWLNNTLVNPDPEKKHVVDLNLSLLEPLGIRQTSFAFNMPISQKAAERISEWLNEISPASPPCLISPGAGWETKRWFVEWYGQLGTALAKETGRPVVVLWGPGEEDLRDAVLSAAHSESVIPAPPTDVLEMTELIRRSALLITNDTGPLHVAVGLGVPTVSIFGPSDPERNGPYGPGHKVLCADVPCLGCWKTVCSGEDAMCCMKGVSVEDVLSAALDML
ncbi:MAG: glycosyltransferase family 9 protein, partial [bacterium]